MSSVTYNGVSLGFVLSKTVEQAPEMDPSGSDHVYSVIRLRFNSIITGHSAGGLPTAKPGEESAAEVCKRIKHELELPRRPFLFEESGVKLFDLPKGRDDANGPIPYGVSVIQLAPGSYVVSWGVEIRLSECMGRGAGHVPLVLSNRWSETVTINEKWLSTVTRRGKLILSGRAVAAGADPDNYRNLVTPAVRTGFCRTAAEYALSESGLEVLYTFVDEEQMAMPPFPAIKATGRQTETAAYPGVVRHGQIDLRLEGAYGTPKKDLYETALRIALSRALAGGLQKTGGGDYLVGGAVVEELFDNVVEVSLRWLVQPTDKRAEPKKGVFGAAAAAALGGVLVGAGQPAAPADPNAPPKPDPPARPGIFARALAGIAQNDPLVNLAQLFGILPEQQIQLNPAGGKPADGKIGPDPPPALAGKPADRAGLTVPVAGWLGKPLPGVTDERGLAPPLRGTADGLRLVAAALKDPCLQELVKEKGEPGDGFVGVMKATARVSVVPGALPEIDLSTPTLYEDITRGAYDHYDVTLHFTGDEGIVVGSSTAGKGLKSLLSPDGTSIGHGGYEDPDPHPVVRLYNPTLHLRVEMTAKRTGGPPVLPDPRATDGNAVFKGGTVSPGMPVPAADGVSMVHTVTAIWNYEYREPHKASIMAPAAPFLSRDARKDAKLTAALVSGTMLFFAPKPDDAGNNTVNIFTGQGVKDVDDYWFSKAPGKTVP